MSNVCLRTAALNVLAPAPLPRQQYVKLAFDEMLISCVHVIDMQASVSASPPYVSKQPQHLKDNTGVCLKPSGATRCLEVQILRLLA